MSRDEHSEVEAALARLVAMPSADRRAILARLRRLDRLSYTLVRREMAALRRRAGAT